MRDKIMKVERKNILKKLLQLVKENISFLVVLLATFLALAHIVTLTFGSFYKSARESAITIGNMTVSQEANRIEDSLYSGMNTLLVSSYTVDAMLSQGAGAEAVKDYLIQETQGIITGIDPDFSGIYGVVHDVYVDGIEWQPEPGYDPYSRPWYQAAADKNGELAIVSPYVDAQTGNVMISFSKLLADGKSAISLDTNLHDIYATTEAIQLNSEGYCFLVDSQGQVVAHRDHGEVGKNYLTDPDMQGSELSALIEDVYAACGDGDAVLNKRLNGSECMIFTESVQDEWYIVLVVDSGALFKDIETSLVRNIIISLVIFIMVGYFCTSNYMNRKKAIRYAENIRTDDLTGLNNRGECDRYLNTTVSGIAMEKKLYLLLFDADNFKQINDRFGHPEGDRALRYIAKALRETCHGTDWFCARYGGDEFVIVCKCDGESVVEDIIQKVADKLNGYAAKNSLKYPLTLSCGYACYKPKTQTIPELVDQADQHLYQVKANKKSGR